MEVEKSNLTWHLVLYYKFGIDGQLRFFHPSKNTTVFKLPKIVRNITDLDSLVDDIEYSDAVRYAKEHRPSTKWRVVRIVCIRFDIYRM